MMIDSSSSSDHRGIATDFSTEEAYRAAAVVFFTRHEDGSVDKVLVALEDPATGDGFNPIMSTPD